MLKKYKYLQNHCTKPEASSHSACEHPFKQLKIAKSLLRKNFGMNANSEL